MGVFDLEEQFAFYGAYHNNPCNIAVHMVFVWPILFSALLLLNFLPPLFSQSPIHLLGQSFLVLNYAFLFTVIYALYYVSLDRKAGSLAALLCFLCWAGSSALGHRLGYSLAWKLESLRLGGGDDGSYDGGENIARRVFFCWGCIRSKLMHDSCNYFVRLYMIPYKVR